MTPNEFIKEWFKYAAETGTKTVIGHASGPFTTARVLNGRELSAAITAAEVSEGKVYFRIHGLQEAPPSVRQRGKAEATTFVAGFALDIDVEGPGKNAGKNYFATKADAIAWVIKTIPYSFIVDSGTGIHVYVQIRGGYTVETPEQLAEIQALSKAFSFWAKEKCPFDLDSVYDLARVLTLPGVGKASVIESTDKSFPLANFQNTLRLRKRDTQVSTVTSTGKATTVDLVLDETCPLPVGVFGLSVANREFAQSWAMEKHPPDASPSGYRFSMISYAMGAGWEPQDACNLAIRFLIDIKGYTPEQCKLDRPDLWTTEVAKCRIADKTTEEILSSGDAEDIVVALGSLMTLPAGALESIHRIDVRGTFDEAVTGCHFVLTLNVGGEKRTVTLTNIMERTSAVKMVYFASGHVMEVSGGKRGGELRRMWKEMCEIAWGSAKVADEVRSTSYEGFVQSLHSYLAADQAETPEEAKRTGRIIVDEEEGVVVVPVSAFLSRQGVTNVDLRNGNLVAQCAARYAQDLGLKTKDFKKRWYKKVNFTCYIIPLDKVTDVLESLE